VARREGFQLDDDILTVFERFEVVWPLVVADMTTNPTSAGYSRLNSGAAKG
jgi:hypothetical protein